MAECPSCARPVALTGPRCLYCGAPLGAAGAQPAAASAPVVAAPRTPARLLLVLDLDGAEAATLARALRLSAYEAELLVRRGGVHLQRLAEAEHARAEAERLGAEGVPTLLIPEGEARTPPLRALAGEWRAEGLALRTEAGPLAISPGSLLLVVTGEIVREYQPRYHRRRPEPTHAGHRWLAHLHRRDAAAAVEIDPEVLGVDGSLTGSARLDTEGWIRALDPAVPRDEGFRWLAPALAPAEPEAADGPVAAARALAVPRRPSRGQLGRVLLDNRAQFRFYSAWRAAAERLRRP